MEPNKLPVIAKRFWSLVRAALFMLRQLRQGISKKKLMLDLNLKLKRVKISAARKSSIHNLIFNYNSAAATKDCRNPPPSPFTNNAYEFSCENSPAHCHHSTASQLNHLTIFLIKKINKHLRLSASSHAPPLTEEEIVLAAEEATSPALLGLGRTPAVRQLRVTGSPFQFRDGDNNDDCGSTHVDEAAEKFIRRFYDNLRRQNSDE